MISNKLTSTEPLFSTRALMYRRQQNLGQGRLVGPPHLAAIVALLMAIVVTSLLFLISNDYARKATVPGFLEYSVTTKRLYPERAGKLERLDVQPGDLVLAGQTLAVLSSHLPLQQEYGRDALADFERLIAQQYQAKEDITANHQLVLTKMQAQIQGLTEASILQREMLSIRALIEAQAGQIHEASRALLEAGQVSSLIFGERQQRWYSSRQATAEIGGILANLQAQKIQLEIAVTHEAVTQRVELLPINTEIARLEQRRNSYLRETRQELIAPLSGRVATLLHEPGEHVSIDMPILTLEPSTGVLQAKLMIASHAICFVRPGQPVNLLYDAFPHQQYGSYSGRVLDVSRHLLTARDRASLPVGAPPVFLATISLAESQINAYGKVLLLREGMTLKADILLESRSLMDWLLEPLLVMRGRGSP